MTDQSFLSLMESVISFVGTDGPCESISRDVLNTFKGSWFDKHFGGAGEITRPYYHINTKTGRCTYQVNVTGNVLAAFIQLHTLPGLFPLYATQLPDNITYGMKLETWLMYLAKYFPEQVGRPKRPRDNDNDDDDDPNEITRDTSRPPKRFRCDHREWQMVTGFLDWVVENHPHIDAFRDGIKSRLQIVMSPTQVFTWKHNGTEEEASVTDLFTTTDDFDQNKLDRIKATIVRILSAQYWLEVDTPSIGLKVGTWELGRAPFSLSETGLWPLTYVNLTTTDTYDVLVLKLKHWDGVCQ